MRNLRTLIVPLFLSLLLLLPGASIAQLRIDEIEGKSAPSLNRSRGIKMLKDIKDVIKTYYYDKNYKGIDIDARFKEAIEKIKTLETNSRISA